METTGDIIKRKREEMGITQKELAKEIKYAASTIGDVEVGRCRPSVDLLKALADFFGCTLDELVGRDSPLKALSPKEKYFIERMRNDPDKQEIFWRVNQLTENDVITVARLITRLAGDYED